MAFIKQIILPDGSTYDVMVRDMIGASALTDGSKGIAPSPSAGDQNKFLRGDGTWSDINISFYVDLATGNLMYEGGQP